jgi:hypothetical protein
VERGENAAIKKYRLKEAEHDGTLLHSVSTYQTENDDLIPGIQGAGPRVVDFANILKYDHIPLAETLQILLNLIKEAMGSPVEIEYAIDLEPAENGLPTFYLLQIKPLIRIEQQVDIDLVKVDDSKILMYAEKGMGNGKVEDIADVVYVDPEKFDKTKTKQIAQEINELNSHFEKENKEYVLIGPGRWGSRDPFTGIPVSWANISKTRIIVEMGLPDFPLDGSLGSHFFHNVTSMNVGYFSIPHNSGNSKLKLEVLKKQKIIHKTDFIAHVRFETALEILMDGKERKALISV